MLLTPLFVASSPTYLDPRLPINRSSTVPTKRLAVYIDVALLASPAIFVLVHS